MLSACLFTSKVDEIDTKSDTGFIHKVTLQLWEK